MKNKLYITTDREALKDLEKRIDPMLENATLKSIPANIDNYPCDFSYAELIEINKKQNEEIIKLQNERYENIMFKKSFFYRLYKFFK